jgi:WD repeat-containing protein 48
MWLIIRNSRLNANRMLRARKVLAYVAERLDPDEIPQENKNQPDIWLDLLCQDKVPRLSSVLTDSKLVPAKWTLQTIRTQMWRQGGDILFTYRLKSEKVEES